MAVDIIARALAAKALNGGALAVAVIVLLKMKIRPLMKWVEFLLERFLRVKH